MKKHLTAIAAASLAVLFATAGEADARRGKSFESDKGFGLGLMLGAPSGLSGKYYLDRGSLALAFGLGAYRDYYYDNGMHVHVDVLWHPTVLATTRDFDLPFYVGVGARLLEHEYYWEDRDYYYYEDHTHVGVRVPFGIFFDLKSTPLDIFIELVPTLDFIDDGHPDNDLDIGAAVGARYYF